MLSRAGASAGPVTSGTVAIDDLPSQQPTCYPLDPCVPLLRAGAHHPRPPLGEPDALVRYRLCHRRAACDLVDEQPQVLALEQARHRLVEEAALDDSPDPPP